MKKLFLIPLLLLSLCVAGCPASTVPGTSNTDQTVTKSLVGIGETLKMVPGIAQTLFDNKTITADQYNKIVPVYKKAKASYVVACDAEEAYLNSTDKATAGAKFDQTMKDLNRSFADLQAVISAYGGKL